jgi:hypothetical protein
MATMQSKRFISTKEFYVNRIEHLLLREEYFINEYNLLSMKQQEFDKLVDDLAEYFIVIDCSIDDIPATLDQKLSVFIEKS